MTRSSTVLFIFKINSFYGSAFFGAQLLIHLALINQREEMAREGGLRDKWCIPLHVSAIITIQKARCGR